MPSERSKDRYERVFKGICVVGIAYKNIERKRDVDGMPSPFQGKFELVPVINVSVEVRRLGGL